MQGTLIEDEYSLLGVKVAGRVKNVLVDIGTQVKAGQLVADLETDDFDRDYEAMRSRGVRFVEKPRREAYGTVAVFVDLYGNRWDLIQPNEPPTR